MNKITIWLLLVFLVLPACRHVLPPDPDDGLFPPVEVQALVLEEVIGDMFMENDGTWSFVLINSQRAPTLTVGQLVGYGITDEDHDFRHLFVVLEVMEWGAQLQRIDVDQMDPKSSGPLIPIDSFDPATAARWNICVGLDEPVSASKCVAQAPPGTMFHVYAVDKKNKFALELEAKLLPIARSAIAWSGQHVLVQGDTKQDRWVAIPAKIVPRLSDPVVGVDSTCPKFDNIGRTIGVDAFLAENMFAIESEAYRLMVDTIAWCIDGNVKIATPAYHRRRLTSDEPRLNTSPVITLEPFDVPQANAEKWLRASALMGAGEFDFADFWIEQALRAQMVPRLALLTMDIAAAAGRPEAAVRRGIVGTAKAWNREASPFWVLGMARVAHGMGDLGQFTERMVEVPDMANSTNSANLTGFLVLNELRRKLRDDVPLAAVALEDLLERTSDPEFETWQLAYRAEAMRHSDETAKLEALRADFKNRGTEDLLDAYLEKNVAQPCPKSNCRLDPYGRRFVAWWKNGPDADEAERVALARFAPGFTDLGNTVIDAELEKLPPLDRIRLAAAFARLAPDRRHPQVHRVLNRTAAQISTSFAAGKIASQDLDRALRSAEASLINATGPDAVPEQWLVVDGIRALCQGPDAFERAAASLEKSPEYQHPGIEVYATLIASEKDPKRRLKALMTGARFAKRFEAGVTCRNWNLALGMIAAQAGRRKPAMEFTNNAAQCAYANTRESEALVQAYLNFERTLTVSLDYARTVREDLLLGVRQKVPRDTCVGLVELNYDVISGAEQALSDLIVGITLKRRPPKELEVVNATDFLYDAIKETEDARLALGRSDAAQAQVHLNAAHDLYDKLGHIPGMRRIEFILDTVFGGKRPSKAQKKLQHGGAHDLQAAQSPSVRIAAAWITRGMNAFVAQAQIEVKSKPLPSLCAQER